MEKKRLVLFSFFVSLSLLLLKFTAYFLTGSNAILTDALESIINVIASGFAFYSIHLAALPKDRNHPYGHGKIEFFSAGFEGALIMLAGIFILYQSIENLLQPQPIAALPVGMLLIGITAVINAVVGWRLKVRGSQLQSITLVADGKHLLVDSLSSAILVVGIGLIQLTNWYTLDSLLSITFSGLILYNGYHLIRKSIAGLMDEADAETLEKLVQVLQTYRRANWIDFHNLRVQKYGADLHIDCHLTLPYYLDLKTVHDEVDQVEALIEQHFPGNVEVFVHVDPCLPPDCCPYCQVVDCLVRQAPFTKRIAWNVQNVSGNQQHFVAEAAGKDVSTTGSAQLSTGIK